MTIKAFIESLEKQPLVCVPEDARGDYIALALEAMEIWSNDAARGYTIAAAEAAGLAPEQIGKLMDAMDAATDEMTVDQAASYYQNGDY